MSAGVRSRREQILAVAAQLFAKHGFHGVSIADLGAAVGVSGPALYRHFPGKEALLAELLVGISEHLLAGGRERAAASDDPREVLAALVGFQVAFALRPEKVRDTRPQPAPGRPKPAEPPRGAAGTRSDERGGHIHQQNPCGIAHAPTCTAALLW